MTNVEIIRAKTSEVKKISAKIPHQIYSVLDIVINKKMDDEKIERQLNKLMEKGIITMESIDEAIKHSLDIQNRTVVEFENIQSYWDAKKVCNLGECWPADTNEGLSGKINAYEYQS